MVTGRLLILALLSWIVAPLPVLIAHLNGFDAGKDVLTFLFATSSQIPFVVVLNEAMAPLLVKSRIKEPRQRYLQLLIAALQFGAVTLSLVQPATVGLSLLHASIVGAASVVGAAISMKSSTRVLRVIVSAPSSKRLSLALAVSGACPGITVVVVFLVYAATGAQATALQELPVITVAALILPNALHLGMSYVLFPDVAAVTRAPAVRPLDLRSLFSALTCISLLLPLTYVANNVKAAVSTLGSPAWILLGVNLLFTLILLFSKAIYLRSDHRHVNARPLALGGLYCIASLAAVAATGDWVASRIALDLVSLALLLTGTAAMIVIIRWYLTQAFGSSAAEPG